MATASNVRGFKQTNGYFVPVGNCGVSSILKSYTGGSGAGGSYLPGSFVPADWAADGAHPAAAAVVATISSIGAGGLLKDMGKTVVSSNRTFRKVQLVAKGAAAAAVNTSGSVGPYLTAYIELATGLSGADSGASPAPVAYLPGLM